MSRRKIGRWLRRLADRIDHHGAPKRTHWRFTFETPGGAKFREDGRGCPLWYFGDDDYDRAHNESDTRHARIDWATMTTRHVGGPQADTLTEWQGTPLEPYQALGRRPEPPPTNTSWLRTERR